MKCMFELFKSDILNCEKATAACCPFTSYNYQILILSFNVFCIILFWEAEWACYPILSMLSMWWFFDGEIHSKF